MFRKFTQSAGNPALKLALGASIALAATSALSPSSAFAQEAAAKPAPAQTEIKLPSIVVTEAIEKPLVDRVIATGTVRPVEEVYVQPLVDALSIKTLNADVGDEVKADSVLAMLNDDALLLQKSQLQANKAKAQAAVAQYQAQVIEAQANVADTTRQRDRLQKLSQSGTGTVSQLEQASAAVEVAQARLNAAKQAVAVGESDTKVVEAQIEDINLKLARTGVKAPVAGVISARTAKVGAIASGTGNPLFTIIKDGAIELVADLSETDIQKIKAGQKAIVTVAGGKVKIEGKVRLVSPTVDAVTRLGAVHIVIDDETGARSGMYGSAEIVITETNALALPLSAVTTGRNGSTARKVEDNVVKQVKIETGIQDGGFVQVVSGLTAGDIVVAKAGAFVRDGDKIAPVPAEPAAIAN
ncbi:Putative efflux transporter, membrane fusion protein subunit; putative HlyD family secretion protein [Neorhizobium galegae bv. officinalis bv. officinalis str. HAMBI 1141]|uniref:Putative efflux transporter, membrane fusion protein subunit putative HlyD family secretion protein n=1 Tax=Neorhizobium galegae bv. officinalis bv. officinalis str. HAMBI 1141 TaxID=1028801 RepID=A0A068TAH3_NEOGA|nr:efflux RND transporter periplasmic adaptor subunit [Neorhizobium galegae]CDN55056.1 Putative efflux transporter, membrane fusion protein subunit; putative HlyD family secretion protein [Neorhizobium galegae bv. officinalis bv. officinalis str. HAMBI 1141]